MHTDCISGSCCVHVCVSLGQTEKSATGSGDTILNALLTVDGKSGRYPELKYNVAAVYTRPLSKGGSSDRHYNGNVGTCMNAGRAIGRAIVGLLKADSE